LLQQLGNNEKQPGYQYFQEEGHTLTTKSGKRSGNSAPFIFGNEKSLSELIKEEDISGPFIIRSLAAHFNKKTLN
jgi:hypothetical protein